jgi:hypothetical protein
VLVHACAHAVGMSTHAWVMGVRARALAFACMRTRLSVRAVGVRKRALGFQCAWLCMFARASHNACSMCAHACAEFVNMRARARACMHAHLTVHAVGLHKRAPGLVLCVRVGVHVCACVSQ